MTNPASSFKDLTEDEVARLAQEVAFLLQPGDTLALEGDLGAGKSTFARALIRAIAGNPDLEIPSPTFTLVQAYETPRFEIAHFDLYRLSDASEIDELGLDAALTRGIAIIEWPSRGEDRIPRDRFAMHFEETADPDRRNVNVIAATPDLQVRLERFIAIRDFLARSGWGDASTAFSYLQGDASPRRYARLKKANGTRAILMDSPQRPDGPPIRDGKSYSAIAHLAESVKAFVAIDSALLATGLSVPRILAQDLAAGLLIIEDFGDKVFGAELARGRDQAELWKRGVEALVAVQSTKPPTSIALSDGTEFGLPEADEGVLEIETQLLLDWYWPALHGKPPPQSARDAFAALWRGTFKRVLRQPKTWLLRDFHSPNLIALDDRASPRDVGIIDFQDAMIGPAAYDLVSLLQDARVNVPENLETKLLDQYVAAIAARDPQFDLPEFRFSYAALGAQRNTKILGIFARLAMRDGKRQYLAHVPRIWGYLERDLQHEDLTALKAWYDENLPGSLRAEALKI
ncbi:tRNA (adenosine(37)-N6)-threonylcarbamoyltransferase complex ATPase subunit type 1 TsaE [Hyphomicrobium sp.]|uniref:tRNA (adenosine(37)-N6)-threonylcarbamoyltransferase complex ATPase subunit type 1 TsaE n=1 Tax=Hyphomicrobium sp. TaxID=82 RepID=UPI002D795E1C|nr:tRNA (adenosine(37)-N6)-threonylcarbamoyltransferase complex ATPase subunit type 1 TsaE [Hyphomicrobium sp.]HET6388616.1 tRNA (adenosine(37)-N6)-threonylcarbamoyltransferase complex ATPase subunit type 1 TsaE [Hyphomicrobium sp.]